MYICRIIISKCISIYYLFKGLILIISYRLWENQRGGEARGMGGRVDRFFLFARLYALTYAKFRVRDTLRHLYLRCFNYCCVFARCVGEMPSRRMRKDAKTRNRSRLPSSV